MTDRDVIALALRENRTHNSLSDIEAAAILAALADAGRMIVPREPTEAMIDEGLIGYGGGELELRLQRKGIKLAFQAMIAEVLK